MSRPLLTRLLRRLRCAIGIHHVTHGYEWDAARVGYVYGVACLWCGRPLRWGGRP